MTTIEPPLPPPPPPTDPPTTTSAAVAFGAKRAPRNPFDRDEKPVLSIELFGSLAVAAFFANLAVRSGLNTVAATLAVLVLGTGLLKFGRFEQRSSQSLVLGAMLLAPWLSIRASVGLTVVTILAIGGLLTIATGLSRIGGFWLVRSAAFVNHLIAPIFEWAGYGVPMFRRMIAGRSGNRRWLSVVRGIVFAVPIVVVLGALLASADDVFANLLSVDSGPSIIGHMLLTGVFGLALLGLASRAAHKTAPFDPQLARVLSPIEVNVVLGSVALLFSAFIATQVAVAVGGVDHVLDTAGLTQAEHARRGFFQLLWVAALTLGLLGVLRTARSTTDPDHKDRYVPLATVLLGFSLFITGVSIQRLAYYVGSFGLTPLRFWSLATAGWIGVMTIAYGMSIHWAARAEAASTPEVSTDPDTVELAAHGHQRSWFPAFMIVSSAVFVFGLNVANPDAFVARYNIDHLPAEQLDVGSLTALSADVVPALTGAHGLSAEFVADVTDELCWREKRDQSYWIFGWNAADAAEQSLLTNNCLP